MAKEETEVPLLKSSTTGSATWGQTLGNIIVVIIGTGVLGLPYAFRVAGWLAGGLGVIIASISIYYCMLLLVQCRDTLSSSSSSSDDESDEVHTYGDLGFKAFGKMGRYLTEFLIVLSQFGGAVAYLIFIGHNLSSRFRTHHISSSSFIFLLVPMEIALSWFRSLSALAPFSIFADICNALAMAIVVKQDLQLFDGLSERKTITSLAALPFAAGVAVFCYEGFGMTLALEASMSERRRFPWVLAIAFSGITLVYVLFGFFGYLAFGERTRDIITLNLPNDWSSTAVKIGLCVGLTFTFPIMMHPINEIIEGKLKQREWFQKLCLNNNSSRGGRARERFFVYVSRAFVVLVAAVVASSVPGFGVFVSMVGSTVSAMLSFVLPTTFHLMFCGSCMRLWQRVLDICILSCGLAFAAYGTYNAASKWDTKGAF
ncbi:amino acid transporter ANT1-like [Macadamia integrifolia]|uniref:amino acid transporter ANT1-like n=1 Tax=Macadamia integrifolia TaxID=60698 RepID=UPI001C4E9A51|nr:amino acid transporter ANT1-like [Macadamia integrifolia]